MGKRYARNLTIGLAVVFVAAVLVAVSLDDNPTVRLAVPVNAPDQIDRSALPGGGGWPYSELVTHEWNLDESHGYTSELLPRVTGRQTLTALLDGNADIAMMSAAPLIKAVANGSDVMVLAQTERSFNQLRLITRDDHVDDWTRHPIGYIPGTTFESMLTAVIIDEDPKLSTDQLQLVGAQSPATLIDDMVSGAVTTSVMLQPQAAAMTRTFDGSTSDFVDITPPGVYLFTGYLVTTAERWDANREGILRALEATAESRRIITEDPENRLREIHNYEAGATPLQNSRPYFWTADEIVFVTDSSDVQADLSAEAELLSAAGIIPDIPDFTDALSILDMVADRT